MIKTEPTVALPRLPDLADLSAAITEHAPLPVATVEGAMHIVRHVNPAFCRLMARPREQLVGKPFRDLLPAKDECVTLLDRVYRTGKPDVHVEPDRSQSRPVFWSYSMWPVQADERFVGIVIQVTETAEFHDKTVAMNEALLLGSLRQHELTAAAEALNGRLQVEISERQKTARDLAEKARLLDLSIDAIIVRDFEGRILYWNHGAEELFGWSREEALGKDIHLLLRTEFPNPIEQITAELHRQGRWTGELVQTKRNGQRITVLARQALDLDVHRRPAAVLESITDISERIRDREALRASEVRYRSLFDSIDEGFCIIAMLFDKKGRPVDYRFLEMNPSFEAQSGIRGAQGKRMGEIVAKVEDYWLEAYGKVARTGKPVRFSNEMKGLNRWFDVYAFRLGGPESQNIAVLFSNITERKQAEKALRDAQVQLADHAVQLEHAVADRTAELTATNQRLEASIQTIEKAQEEYRKLLMESQIMQRKLRQLTHQILTAQEEERKKISRELHDEVVQMLVGINVELSVLAHGSAVGVRHLKNKIAHTQRLVESSVDAVHRFARELRPAVLDDLGLIPALHAFCKNLAGRKKIKIKLTAFGGVEALGSAERTVLFRVAQEALTNIVRHARATHARVAITRIAGAIRMEIGDNGKSFAVKKTFLAKNPKRLGLVGMKERIEMIGGNLTIESVSGTGTTVRAEIPFAPSPALAKTKSKK